LFLVQLLPALEARRLMVLEPKYGQSFYGLGAQLRSYFFPSWFDFNPVRYVLVRDGAAHDAVLAARLIGRRDVFCHVHEYVHAKPPYHWEDRRDGRATPTGWIPERREFLV